MKKQTTEQKRDSDLSDALHRVNLLQSIIDDMQLPVNERRYQNINHEFIKRQTVKLLKKHKVVK